MIYYISDIDNLKTCLDTSLSDYGTKMLNGLKYSLRNTPTLRVATNQVKVYKKFLNSIIEANQYSYPCYNPIETEFTYHFQDGTEETRYKTTVEVKYTGQTIKVLNKDYSDEERTTLIKSYYTYKPKPVCVNSCLSNCNISTLFSEISNYINNLNCMNC